MDKCICLCIPNSNICLKPGQKIRLNKFDARCWTVSYGWYTWGGNRPVCGWYLVTDKPDMLKPLQLTDLDDMYMIES